MTCTPKPEEMIDIAGPKGKTLFNEAKSWLLTGKEQNIQAQLYERWQYYSEATDDRLVAIIAALCIESSMDALLSAMAPGFKDYAEDTNFTFSIKTKMISSLRLLPERILTACDLIRQIRNEFAHHVHYKRFEDLGEKRLKNLEPYVRSFNTAQRDPNAVQRLFKELVAYSLTALIVYTEQVSRFRQYAESDTGKISFSEWCKTAIDQPMMTG